MTSATVRAWAVLVAVCLATFPSLEAQAAEGRTAVGKLESKRGGSERPWGEGVSAARQKKAQQLVDEGNALLKESFFAQAIPKYRASLELWDHPGAHYNLALALLTMDEPIETLEHFEKSIAYGPEPLGKDKFDNAQKYITLLEKQIARLDVSCDEPGAMVRLDGKLLFEAPGRWEGPVLRGEHSITASKPGYEKTEVTRSLDPGPATELHLKLYRPEELIVYERKYPLWIPITVTATGVVLAGAGGLSAYLSQNSYDELDQTVAADPSCSRGCEPSGDAAGQLDRGELFQTLSYVGYAAGGAVTALGITLWALDDKTSRRVTPAEKQGFAVVPLISPDGVGVVGRGHF